MNTQYESLRAEISRLISYIQFRTLEWEPILGRDGVYRTRGIMPCITVSCGIHGHWIQIADQKLNVPGEELLGLCAAIVEEIMESMRRTTELLQSITASCKTS